MSEFPAAPEGASQSQQLIELFDFVDELEPPSILTALKNGEDLTREPPTAENDTLADYDRPSTEYGRLQFDQQLGSIQHQAALAMAGLEFNKDAFSNDLLLADGQRFAFTLSSFGDNERIRKGLIYALEDTMMQVVAQYSIDCGRAADTATNSLPGDAAHELTDQHNHAVQELLQHAPEIAHLLGQTATYTDTAEKLTAMHSAELEGMRAEWAVAACWELFDRPTKHTYWTKWEDEQSWQPFFVFLQNAYARHGSQSPFLRGLTSGMIQKVANLRSGNIVPPESPPIKEVAIPDDIDRYLEDLQQDTSPPPTIEQQEYRQQMLLRIRQRLERFL